MYFWPSSVKKIIIGFLDQLPNHPAARNPNTAGASTCNPNYWGAKCNPNYWGKKITPAHPGLQTPGLEPATTIACRTLLTTVQLFHKLI